MSDTIWIGYREGSYEGCTEPLFAFASKDLAEAWRAASSETYYVAEIIELPIARAALSQDTPSLPLKPQEAVNAGIGAPPPSDAGTNPTGDA